MFTRLFRAPRRYISVSRRASFLHGKKTPCRRTFSTIIISRISDKRKRSEIFSDDFFFLFRFFFSIFVFRQFVTFFDRNKLIWFYKKTFFRASEKGVFLALHCRKPLKRRLFLSFRYFFAALLLGILGKKCDFLSFFSARTIFFRYAFRTATRTLPFLLLSLLFAFAQGYSSSFLQREQ